MKNNKDILDKIRYDIKNKYIVRLLCADCGKELNRSKEMTGKEICDNWVMIVMGSGFNAGKCKKGCRSTFSDLNINTDFKITKVRKKVK